MAPQSITPVPYLPRFWKSLERQVVWTGPGLTPCYYCGRIADTVDHVVPQVFLAMLPWDEVPDLGVDLVPACKQCNCALGARFYESLGKRKEAAKDWLRRHYAKLLKMPHWRDHELAELPEGKIRDYVVASIVAKEELDKMLAW